MSYKNYFRFVNDQTKDVKGCFVECGVGSGGTINSYVETSRVLDIPVRPIHGFDSFQGLPEPSIHDKNDEGNSPNKGLVNRPRKYIDRYIDFWNKNDYNLDITIYEGWFKDTFPTCTVDTIAILHLDVDIYDSYLDSLNYFYNKVEKQGYILFDEYDNPSDLEKWAGAKKAIDLFFSDKPETLYTFEDNDFRKTYTIKQ